LLNVCFKYASADGYISRNPAELIHIEGESREYIPTQLKPVELAEFIEVWDSHELLKEYANYVVGLAYTGARPQELGALTWDDIDLQARTLDINKAIKTTHTGKQYVSNILKTESASRVLGIDEVLLARLRFRKTTNPSDTYVFSSSRGEMINLNNFRSRYFKPAILKTELPIERPYDLRHTFGALMWSRGVKLDRLSRMFGHSSYTTTESWYGTWYREADFSGIEDLEKWKQQQA
jgi:integrase